MNVFAAGYCLAFRSGSLYLIVKLKKGLCLDFQVEIWLGPLERRLSSSSPFLASSGSQLLVLGFWLLASGFWLLASGSRLLALVAQAGEQVHNPNASIRQAASPRSKPMPKSNDHRPATICRCGWIHRRGSIPKCPLATPTESMEVPVPPAKKPRTSTTYKVRVQDSRYRLSTLFTQARRRKLECSVSLAQFTQITSQPCRYCGDASSAYRGIDRLDNNRGYVPGNMVPSCSRCNYMKSSLSESEFAAHIASI